MVVCKGLVGDIEASADGESTGRRSTTLVNFVSEEEAKRRPRAAKRASGWEANLDLKFAAALSPWLASGEEKQENNDQI